MADATLRMILLGEDRSAGKALKSVGDQSEKTGSKLHSVASVASKALAGGFLIAGAAAMKFGKNAADDEAAARRLAIALKNTTGATDEQVASVEDWITAQGKAFGVSDDQLRPAMERLVTATHDVGQAQKLASLAMDISAGTGKDLSTVSMALAKAQNGNVASLGRLGLKVKDADGKTKSLHEVTKDLAETYKGQAAAAADSTAGKQQRLNLALDEAGESIGYKLIPVMLKLTEVATAALNWMEAHPRLLKNGAIAVGALAVGMAALIVLEKAHAAAMAVQAAGGLAKWLKATKAVTAGQWLLNAALSANPIGLVVLAIAGLVAAFVVAYKKSETFRNIVNGAFRAVTNAASATFNWVRSHWPLLLAILTGPIGAAAILIAKNWDKITTGAQGVLDFIKGMPGKIRGFFGGIWGGLASGLKDAINAVLHLPLTIPKINTHIPGVGTVGGQTLIPALAKGGIVTRPTLALIGEAGPEAVVPLHRAAGATLGGGVDQLIGTRPLVLKMDSQTVWQGLLELKRTKRGVTLGLA